MPYDAHIQSEGQHTIAWDQIRGQRPSQQDSALWVRISATEYLLILADGLGGEVAGDVASSVAVSSFCDAYETPAIPEEPRARLMAALQATNLALHDRIVAEPELAGMATTLVAAVVYDGLLQWVSVGDSPMWLFRRGEVRRLNANHSVAGELAERVAAGEMTAAEAAASPARSLLFEAVHGADIKLVDAPDTPFPLELGDIVVLASDGVESCSPKELAEIVSGGDTAEELVDRILRAVEAHERTFQDNATLIAIRLPMIGTDDAGRLRLVRV